MGAAQSNAITATGGDTAAASPLRSAFDQVSQGDGSASIADLQRLPGLHANRLVPRLLAVFDADGDGALLFAEFARAALVLGVDSPASTLAAVALRVFDRDRDGRVGAADLFLVLRDVVGGGGSDVGFVMSDAHLERVALATVAAYDEDGDGFLTAAELGRLLTVDELRAKFACFPRELAAEAARAAASG